jgi:hypothetical protein
VGSGTFGQFVSGFMHLVTFPMLLTSIGDSLMTVDLLIEKLRAMLKNPNAIALDDDVIYLYTSDGEIISFSVE